MSSALLIKQAKKYFKTAKNGVVKAVDNISLNIQPGQIYGLLGPNGAGKSTLIHLISGILLPDHGQITLFGHDVVNQSEDAKKILGVVPQEVVVEAAFTVQEVLYYYAGMFGVPVRERNARIAEVLEDLSLSDKRFARARTLSGGMKRRLMIAKALLHKPKLLILDEPTAGVDVALRQKIWELVRRLNREGTTILFTTHYLEEAEQLCESITLVDHGRIIKQGKVKTLLEEFSGNVIHFEVFDPGAPQLEGVSKIGTEYEYPINDLAGDIARILKFYDGNIKSIRSESASLEEVFLKLTKS